MAPNKASSHKPAQKHSGKASSSKKDDSKKGSKLASLKSAIIGAAKKKLGAAPVVAKSHKNEKATPKAAVKAEAMKEKETASKKAKAAHPPVHAAKGAAAHAKSEAPAAGKKGAAPVAAPAGKKGRAAPTAASLAAAALSRAKPGSKPAPSRASFGATDESNCREVACEGLATAGGYCRMHYIKNWKKIKRKEVILKEGKLNQYIEELVVKYPDKYIEAIRQDLANDKDFAKVIYDLDLDESVDDFDPEGESLDGIVGDIKRDFDDEGDTGF